jgi:hypothetical protein
MPKGDRLGLRTAELQYSPEYSRLELVVPHGTKTAEFVKLREVLFTDLLARLPRGCPACLSGESLIIRERLEHVLRIDLDSMSLLDG